MLSPVEAYVRKHLQFNFVVGLLDGGFFSLGTGFGSFEEIISLFVHHLTGSAMLIGLVPAIHNLGWRLPQLMTAGMLSRLSRFKSPTLSMTIHERLPFLRFFLVALALPQRSFGTLILIATFVLLICQGSEPEWPQIPGSILFPRGFRQNCMAPSSVPRQQPSVDQPEYPPWLQA